MTEEGNKYNWKSIAMTFSVILAISFVVNIAQMDTISKQNKNINENYESKCTLPSVKICLMPDQQISYCSKDQYSNCYNPLLQSVAVCNKADDMVATCMTEDYTKYITCQDGYSPNCVKSGEYCNTCDAGYQSSCLDKTKWSVWTGSYVYSCSVGQTAQCK